MITHRSTAELLTLIEAQQATIARLSRNQSLNMLNNAGLHEAIAELAPGAYTVVLFDIDHLKKLNSATGNHFTTNAYLARGLAVREGEIIGQLFGDEFVAVIQGRAGGFIARIAKQLAQQALSLAERRALLQAGAQPWLSATFEAEEGVDAADVLAVLPVLSARVLAQKEARDAKGARG